MSSAANRNSTIGTVIFMAGMLAAALLFANLGFWQMERLAWKEQLIASLPPEQTPHQSQCLWQLNGQL